MTSGLVLLKRIDRITSYNVCYTKLLRVTVTQGTCEANDSVLVNIVDLPEVFDLGETIYACEGTTVTIEGPAAVSQYGVDLQSYNFV